MGKAFAALSEEQKQNFENRLKELGLDRSHVISELRTGATAGPTYLSSHPGTPSQIPPQMITIDNLDKLKRLGGIPDQRYALGEIEDHHEIPPPWPEEKNLLKIENLTPEDKRNIRQAFIAQIYGNSKKTQSYEKVIEKCHFPVQVAAFAAEDVVVDADHPLILKGPTHVYNFGTVTIKPGGQIRFEADLEMTVQKMIKE